MGGGTSKLRKEFRPRFDRLERDNKELKKQLKELRQILERLDLKDRVEVLEIEKLEIRAELKYILDIVRELDKKINAHIEESKKRESLAESPEPVGEKTVRSAGDHHPLAEQKAAVYRSTSSSVVRRDSTPSPAQTHVEAAAEIHSLGTFEDVDLSEEALLVVNVMPWSADVDVKQLELCLYSLDIDGLKWEDSKVIEVWPSRSRVLQLDCRIERNKIHFDSLKREIENSCKDHVQRVELVSDVVTSENSVNRPQLTVEK